MSYDKIQLQRHYSLAYLVCDIGKKTCGKLSSFPVSVIRVYVFHRRKAAKTKFV